MTDREQIRADAKRQLPRTLAYYCLQLLDELKQAERETKRLELQVQDASEMLDKFRKSQEEALTLIEQAGRRAQEEHEVAARNAERAEAFLDERDAALSRAKQAERERDRLQAILYPPKT